MAHYRAMRRDTTLTRPLTRGDAPDAAVVAAAPAVDFSPAGLRERAASHYTGLSVAYLRAARVGRCAGPAYVRIGRAVVYLRADLDAFMAARRVS